MSVENLKNISPFYQPRCMAEGRGDLGTGRLGECYLWSPRHPVTPSPRHPVTPSPPHPVTPFGKVQGIGDGDIPRVRFPRAWGWPYGC
jgi:hypothetical protein